MSKMIAVVDQSVEGKAAAASRAARDDHGYMSGDVYVVVPVLLGTVVGTVRYEVKRDGTAVIETYRTSGALQEALAALANAAKITGVEVEVDWTACEQYAKDAAKPMFEAEDVRRAAAEVARATLEMQKVKGLAGEVKVFTTALNDSTMKVELCSSTHIKISKNGSGVYVSFNENNGKWEHDARYRVYASHGNSYRAGEVTRRAKLSNIDLVNAAKQSLEKQVNATAQRIATDTLENVIGKNEETLKAKGWDVSKYNHTISRKDSNGTAVELGLALNSDNQLVIAYRKETQVLAGTDRIAIALA